MHVSIGSYTELETRCNELCDRCNKIIKNYDEDDPKVKEEASIVYDEIVALKKELEITIQTNKSFLIRWKSKKCLKNISLYEMTIYVIAKC